MKIYIYKFDDGEEIYSFRRFQSLLNRAIEYEADFKVFNLKRTDKNRTI